MGQSQGIKDFLKKEAIKWHKDSKANIHYMPLSEEIDCTARIWDQNRSFVDFRGRNELKFCYNPNYCYYAKIDSRSQSELVQIKDCSTLCGESVGLFLARDDIPLAYAHEVSHKGKRKDDNLRWQWIRKLSSNIIIFNEFR